MGAINTRPEEKCADKLPKIHHRYVPVSILSKDVYGYILRIREPKSKKDYAFRVVKYKPMDQDRGKKSQDKLKKVQTEKKILSKIAHPNVIKYFDSFAVNCDPLNPTKKEPFLGLRLEHCPGNHLGALLRQIEIGKMNRIPVDQIVNHFDKLLKALQLLHRIKIIHRNLRPSNILIKTEQKSGKARPGLFEVRFSDFGLARDEKSTLGPAKTGNIVGKIFYSSQELSEGKGYDMKSDVYSLGLILFQSYTGMSVRSFNAMINKLRAKLKEEGSGEVEEEEEIEGEGEEEEKGKKKKKKTPKKGKKKKANVQKKEKQKTEKLWKAQLNDLKILHERGMVREEILKRVEDDPAFQHVISRMTDTIDKRPTSEQLSKDEVLMSWRYLYHGRLRGGAGMKPETVDIRAAVSMLKFRREKVFKRCMEVLKSRELSEQEVDWIMKGEAHKWLCVRVSEFLPKMKKRKSEVRTWAKDVMSILVSVLVTLSKTRPDQVIPYFQKISANVRTHGLLMMFRAYLKKVAVGEPLQEIPSELVLLFCLALTSASGTISQEFSDLAPQIATYSSGKKNLQLLGIGILENLMPFVQKNNLVKVLQNYKGSDLCFTKSIPHEILEDNMNVLNTILDRLKKVKLDKLTDSLQLRTAALGVFLSNDYRIVGRGDELKLVKPDKKFPSPKCKFKIHRSSEPKSVKLTKGTGFVTLSDKKAELVTTESILSLKGLSKGEEEEAIGYFEVMVEYGGENDKMMIGLNLHPSVKRRILWNPAEKTAVLSYAVMNTGASGKKIFRNNFEKFEVGEKEVYPQPGDVVGAGITNKGNVFFTYNGKLQQPFVSFFDDYPNPLKKGLFGIARVIGNKKFKGYGIFTKTRFPFGVETIKEPVKIAKVANLVSNLSGKWTKICKKKKNEKSEKEMIYVACSRLLDVFDVEPAGEIDDVKFSELYHENAVLSALKSDVNSLELRVRKLCDLKKISKLRKRKKKGEEEEEEEVSPQEKKKKGPMMPRLPITAKIKKKDDGEEVKKLKSELESTKKKLKDFEDKMKKVEEDMEKKEKENEELKKEVNSLKERMKKKKKGGEESEKLREELISQNEKIANLMLEIENLQVASPSEEDEMLTEKVKGLEVENEELKEKIKELEEKKVEEEKVVEEEEEEEKKEEEEGVKFPAADEKKTEEFLEVVREKANEEKKVEEEGFPVADEEKTEEFLEAVREKASKVEESPDLEEEEPKEEEKVEEPKEEEEKKEEAEEEEEEEPKEEEKKEEEPKEEEKKEEEEKVEVVEEEEENEEVEEEKGEEPEEEKKEEEPKVEEEPEPKEEGKTEEEEAVEEKGEEPKEEEEKKGEEEKESKEEDEEKKEEGSDSSSDSSSEEDD